MAAKCLRGPGSPMLLSWSISRQMLLVRPAETSRPLTAAAARLQRIVHAHLDAVWRTARDLGVPSRDLEDVVQEVLLVVTRRIEDIQTDRERAFVLGTTARVVANFRRTRRRRPEDLTESM